MSIHTPHVSPVRDALGDFQLELGNAIHLLKQQAFIQVKEERGEVKGERNATSKEDDENDEEDEDNRKCLPVFSHNREAVIESKTIEP